jgi:hypothetical protein
VFLAYRDAMAIPKLALFLVLLLQYAQLKVVFAIVISACEFYSIMGRMVRKAHAGNQSPCQQRRAARAMV